MKRSFLLFISPILVLFCSLIMWLIGVGSAILPIWLFRDLCIPIIHFSIVSQFIKKYSSKNGKIIFAILLYVVTIVVNMVMLGLLKKNGGQILFFSAFNALWAIICGLVIIGHSMIVRTNISKTIIGGIVTVEALLALASNAMLTWILSPILAASFAIDDVELLILPLSAIILCLFSYLLGITLTQHHIGWKLFAWLIGVTMSVFVSLWLIGSPHILPYTDSTLTTIWVVVSIIIFACSFIGVIQRKRGMIVQAD